jgi:hypothetical protein
LARANCHHHQRSASPSADLLCPSRRAVRAKAFYRSTGPWGSWRASRRWRNALIPQRVAK